MDLDPIESQYSLENKQSPSVESSSIMKKSMGEKEAMISSLTKELEKIEFLAKIMKMKQ